MSFLNKLFAGAEDRIVQHEYEQEKEDYEYALRPLGKLKLEPGDMIVCTTPEQNQDYIIEKIRRTGDSLEAHLGWRPLVIAMPEGWAMGAVSREGIAEFCRSVLRALEAQDKK